MDCSAARKAIHQLIDGELAPGARAEVLAHLGSCPACAAEREDLEAVLEGVRSMPLEPLPPGLEAAVLAAAPAGKVAPVRSGRRVAAGEARTSGASRAALTPRPRSMAPRLLAAAAAILLIALSVSLYLEARTAREGSRAAREESRKAQERLEQIGGDLARAEQGRKGAEAVAEVARAGLAAARSELAQEREGARGRTGSAEESLREAKKTRAEMEDLRGRLAGLEADAGTRRQRIADLEESLEQVREEAARERAERTRLEVLLAEARRAAETKAIARGTARGAGASPGPKPPGSVALRERGGSLELQVDGREEEIVPRLLELAQGDGEGADLALGALEEMLGVTQEPEAPAESRPANLAEWWDRGVDRLAIAAGVAERREPPPPDPAEVRKERLRKVEEAWERRSAERRKTNGDH